MGIGPIEGQASPDFTLQSITGEKISNRDCLGYNTILLIVRRNSTLSLETIRTCELLFSFAEERELKLLLIDAEYGTEAATRQVDTNLSCCPYWHFLSTSNDYDLSVTPFYYYIDKDGVMVSKGMPHNNFPQWNALREELLCNLGSSYINPAFLPRSSEV
jgi:hypothetical protein